LTEKRTQDSAKQRSADIILKILALESPLRWSDLLEKTKLSSRTLKKTLDRLVNELSVYREQKNDQGYPPPVFYGLTLIGEEDAQPFHYGHRLGEYIFGAPIRTPLDVQSADFIEKFTVKGQNGDIRTLERRWKTPYTGMENVKIIESMGRRVGIAYLYSILQSYDKNNFAWYHYALENLFNAAYFPLMFFRNDEGTSVDGMLTSDSVKELKGLLRELYPEEYAELERILSY
jgi:DNA-binding HxlR family transcriptional regulator